MPCRGTQPGVEVIRRRRGRNVIRLYDSTPMVTISLPMASFVVKTLVGYRGTRVGLAAAVFTLASTSSV